MKIHRLTAGCCFIIYLSGGSKMDFLQTERSLKIFFLSTSNFVNMTVNHFPLC